MTDTKPKRIRLSPEARQEHLLDCSAEMIATDGIAGFTMEGLAKRANVSAPLVYNYFPNRIELLQTLLKREMNPDVVAIAAGDAPNDGELLEMADYALLMRNSRGTPLRLQRSGPTWLSDSAGPAAWAKGISEILTSMGWDI